MNVEYINIKALLQDNRRRSDRRRTLARRAARADKAIGLVPHATEPNRKPWDESQRYVERRERRGVRISLAASFPYEDEIELVY